MQFPLNQAIYQRGGVIVPGSGLSLFEWLLREQEHVHSLVRRYESPDEYPFFAEALQTPVLAPIEYPAILHPNDVCVNDQLLRSYVMHILPAACARFGRSDRGESQENYGSAATCDVAAVQALSRRIHFGKFVAEAKFRSQRDHFVRLIKAADRAAIEAAITNPQVEQKVLDRLHLKANTYGTDPDNAVDVPVKINADAVVAMYKVRRPASALHWRSRDRTGSSPSPKTSKSST